MRKSNRPFIPANYYSAFHFIIIVRFSYFAVIFSSRFPTYRLVFMLNLPISHVCLNPVCDIDIDTITSLVNVVNFAMDDAYNMCNAYNSPNGMPTTCNEVYQRPH